MNRSQRPVRIAGKRPTVIGLHTGDGTAEEWWPLAEGTADRAAGVKTARSGKALVRAKI
jgi:hypothetical protein